MNIGKIEQSLSGVKTQNNSFTQNTTPSINQGTIQSGKQQVVNMPTVFQEPEKSKGSQLADLLGVGVKGLAAGAAITKDIKDTRTTEEAPEEKRAGLIRSRQDYNNIKEESLSLPLNERNPFINKKMGEAIKTAKEENWSKAKTESYFNSFVNKGERDFNVNDKITNDLVKEEVYNEDLSAFTESIDNGESFKEASSLMFTDMKTSEKRELYTKIKGQNIIDNMTEDPNYDYKSEIEKLREEKIDNKMTVGDNLNYNAIISNIEVKAIKIANQRFEVNKQQSEDWVAVANNNFQTDSNTPITPKMFNEKIDEGQLKGFYTVEESIKMKNDYQNNLVDEVYDQKNINQIDNNIKNGLGIDHLLNESSDKTKRSVISNYNNQVNQVISNLSYNKITDEQKITTETMLEKLTSTSPDLMNKYISNNIKFDTKDNIVNSLKMFNNLEKTPKFNNAIDNKIREQLNVYKMIGVENLTEQTITDINNRYTELGKSTPDTLLIDIECAEDKMNELESYLKEEGQFVVDKITMRKNFKRALYLTQGKGDLLETFKEDYNKSHMTHTEGIVDWDKRFTYGFEKTKLSKSGFKYNEIVNELKKRDKYNVPDESRAVFNTKKGVVQFYSKDSNIPLATVSLTYLNNVMNSSSKTDVYQAKLDKLEAEKTKKKILKEQKEGNTSLLETILYAPSNLVNSIIEDVVRYNKETN